MGNRKQCAIFLWMVWNSTPINNKLPLQEGEIFIYDGRETISDLDTTQHCLTQSGKCITNTSIVLWNKTEAVNVYIERLDITKHASLTFTALLMNFKWHLHLSLTKQLIRETPTLSIPIQWTTIS
ncbi:hypothetical protein LOAG_19179 [Loa loa]|uniref:Uncharacterized protein n=1 Tax=Loa loa TaxID=7209 RepID=A0A1S0UES8_LOALO|nr:hypothetical protein LOAG_19343 [Loa loa]XP_020304359.1 hypothetical protein LOAG_19179 [Loa loa]EJD73246.1 hypothetical protein LOAG_19343 [Loa loa]EJD73397.1 hypothetical protein LOAG_19179 [Loa loa]